MARTSTTDSTTDTTTDQTMNVRQLFPYPLGITRLERSLTDHERQTVESLSKEVRENSGNFSTRNTQVLELPEFAVLKQDLEHKVLEYFTEVYDPQDSVEPNIVLSWLNYTKQDGFHHKHNHPNSLISGVFYVNANPAFDKINFYDSRYEPIEIVAKNYNKFNSRVWHVPVQTGDLILFPSYLEHGVEFVKHNMLRISLAFNVWVRGTIGTDERLTTLSL